VYSMTDQIPPGDMAGAPVMMPEKL
jgi:hypothetical protein